MGALPPWGAHFFKETKEMRTTIEIKIPYWDTEEKEKTVKISFISNRCNSEYNRLMDQVSTVQALQEEQKKIQENMGSIIAETTIKNLRQQRDKIKPLKAQLKSIITKIKEDDGKVMLADRFALIKKILEQNGCTDHELLSMDFWDEKTEVKTPWTFLHQAIMKDLQSGGVKKKK